MFFLDEIQKNSISKKKSEQVVINEINISKNEDKKLYKRMGGGKLRFVSQKKRNCYAGGLYA